MSGVTGAGTTGTEDLQSVGHVGKAVLAGDLVRPALDSRSGDLDRRPALPADEMMVMGTAAPPEQLLPAVGAGRVDLTGVDQQLQGAVDGGETHLGSLLPQD